MSHEVEHHIHESPKSMMGPLVVLAICSVCSGWLGVPASLGGTNVFGKFLEPVFAQETSAPVVPIESQEPTGEDHRGLEWTLMLLSVGIAVAGGVGAYGYYAHASKDYPEPIAVKAPPLYTVLYNKWFVDEGYDYVFTGRRKIGKVRLGAIGAGEAASWFDAKVIDGAINDIGWVTRAVAMLSSWWDKWIIDGLGVNVPATLARMISYPARLFAWGLVQWYALVMVAGLLGFGVYYVWK